jgi:hypothetical protein
VQSLQASWILTNTRDTLKYLVEAHPNTRLLQFGLTDLIGNITEAISNPTEETKDVLNSLLTDPSIDQQALLDQTQQLLGNTTA